MGELARVKTVLTGFAGAPGYSTQHFTKTTPVGWDYYAPRMVTRVQDAWGELVAILNNSETVTTLGTIDIIDEATGEILSTYETSSDSLVGTGTAYYAPLASGICVTFRTAGVVAGKHVRGRTFIVPVDSNAIAPDGSPSDGALLAANAFGDTMASVAEPNLHACVYSRPVHATLSGPAPRVGSAHTITSTTVADKFAVLRSRRD